LEKDGETSERYGEKVLISTGRTAYTQGLFDQKLGIKTHRGYIETDNCMKTSLNNIFAIGDVNGKHMLAHVATAEGIVAVENALGIKSQMSYDAVPRCIYTSPEVASVGMSEKEAAASGIEIKTGKYPTKANGRSLADGNIEGFCKVISEKITGKIIGIHIVAPYATEMITEGTIAVNLGIKDTDLARIIHPHPTVSEIIAEAASNALLQD
jgi:dihydrolipoamide dehydrogenase